MTTRIKLRRDDTSNWEALNPVLALGEPGYNTTENKIKIGDGVTAWVDLLYLTDAQGNSYTLPAATTNVLGGIKLGEGFVLDGNNKVTTSKLYSTNLTQPDQHYRLELDTNGVVVLPDQSIINGSTLKGIAGTGELNYTGIVTGPSSGNSENTWMYVDAYDAYIATDYADSQHTWKFDRNGNLTLPVGGDILNSSGQTVLGGGGAADLGNFIINGNTLVLPNNQTINASSAEVLTVGTSNAKLYLDSEYQVAKITAKKTFNRNFSENGEDDVDTFVYTSGSVAVQFIANNGLYFKELLSRLANYFDGNNILQNDYSNVRLVINPDTANLQSTVTNVTSDFNDPPTYSITLGTAHTGPITITDINISYDYNNTIGLDVDSDYFGISTDNDDIDIRSGRDIDLFAADDARMRAGGDLEIELVSNDGRPLTSGIDLITRTNADSKTWTFRFDGDLRLPEGGDIINSNGDSVLGGNGNITLSARSTLKDTELGVELTINEASPQWYSVYGDLNTTGLTSTNATISGSTVRDVGGNVFVLGSIVDNDINYTGNNLFLKYTADGELLWSRTWTDANDLNCGSYNASMRYNDVRPGVSDRETITWASYAPYNNYPYAYIGTMDMDGELVDGFGSARAPVEMANIRIADLEVTVGSNVYVVGARITDNFGNVAPFIAKVNLSTYTANVAITIAPPDFDSTDTSSDTNFFKSVTANANYILAAGSYRNSDVGRDWPILVKHVDGGATSTYHLTANSANDTISAEVVAYSSYHDAEYVVMNNTSDAPFGIVGKLASDYSGYTWLTRIGDGTGLRILGLTFDTTGYIYVVGEVYLDGDTNFLLIQMDAAGEVVWQRNIGSSAYDGTGAGGFFPPGWDSSSSITIDGTDVVITGITQRLNSGQTNAITIKYPTDGSLTGNFGNFYAETISVGFATDWAQTIQNVTIDTLVTIIDGNTPFRNDIREASLIATTKTLDAGFDTYHWDMTNNRLYYPERKWIFDVDGALTLPSGAYLEEDEPGTLYIHSTGGTSINYSKHPAVADYEVGETTFSSVIANSNGVMIRVDKKIGPANVEQRSEWEFNNNGGLIFPDNTVQYGAYLVEEMMLDGGSAVSEFPLNVTTPRFVEGGGSGSRYGTTSPTYEGGTGGATLAPNDFTLLLNGGGA